MGQRMRLATYLAPDMLSVYHAVLCVCASPDHVDEERRGMDPTRIGIPRSTLSRMGVQCPPT